MENFKQLFFDEAGDLLEKLEESLLDLEEDMQNLELINEVFRIMHSLKGSGSMFGFTHLSNLTHDLETLYDKIKNDELKLNSDIITFTMSTIDHINELLKDDSNPNLLEKTDILKGKIVEIISKESGEEFLNEIQKTKTLPTENIATSSTTRAENKKLISGTKKKNFPNNKKTYFIKFIPNQQILNDGTNPLYLIDELVELGDNIVWLEHDNIKPFESLETEKIFISWSLILSTEKKQEEISDVFIFVDDDCELTIKLLSENDLFEYPEFISDFKSSYKGDLNYETVLEAVKIFNNNNNKNNSTNFSSTDTNNDASADSVTSQINSEKKKEGAQNPLEDNTKKNKPGSAFPESVQINTVSVSALKLDALINLVSELVTTEARFANLAKTHQSSQLIQLSEHLQLLTRQFREISFEMRLIPIQALVLKFKRLVRDLSKELGKKVELTTEGTETEMDKSIISTISDPVMHIIRNSIDHGIESPEERLKSGKAETGKIHFKAYSEGTSIVISLKDDGRGIDKEQVIKTALQRDVIKETTELNDDEIFSILMKPGFSTRKNITGVSGRGVGMDVVRTKIEDLRGDVSIKSVKGEGTEVILRLPLTLSIIDGLLVSINNEQFIIPLSDIVQIYRISKEKLNNARNNIVDIEGVQYTFLNLPELFEGNTNVDNDFHFINITYNDKVVGLVINNLISEYQAVLKPVNKVLRNNEIFSGATILGDGNIAMVIDTKKLVEFYSEKKLIYNDKQHD